MKVPKINNTVIQTVICFSIPWVFSFLFFLVGKTVYYSWEKGEFWDQVAQFPHKIWFWGNFLPAMGLFGIGWLINYGISKKKKVTLKELVLPAIMLIFVDQVIQFCMVRYHESIHLVVIEDWLTIIPQSMIESQEAYLSNAQMPVSIHWMLLFFLIPVGYGVFRFLYFFEQKRSHLYVSFVWYGAGYICSCLDLLIYKDCYDYIKLYPIGIFDIKDIYLAIGFYTLFQSMLQNAGVLNQVQGKDLPKYVTYEYQSIKRWVSNLRNNGGKREERGN